MQIMRLCCSCFFGCFFWAVMVVQAETIKEYSRQAEIARRIVDLAESNWGSIRTWTGTVLFTREKMKDVDSMIVESCYENKIIFYYDVAKNWFVAIKEPVRAYDTEEGIKKDQYRYVMYQGMLFKDDLYYAFSSDPVNVKKVMERRLDITPTFKNNYFFFDPMMAATSSVPMESAVFHKTMLFSDEQINLWLKRGQTMEEILARKAEWQRNGITGMTFAESNGIVTEEYVGNRYVVDLNKGGNYLLNEGGGRKWSAEYQHISGVWIPKKIVDLSQQPDGRFIRTAKIWTNQKINEPIPDDIFSIKTLGVRRGDTVYDERTGTVAKIEGSEYPEALFRFRVDGQTSFRRLLKCRNIVEKHTKWAGHWLHLGEIGSLKQSSVLYNKSSTRNRNRAYLV